MKKGGGVVKAMTQAIYKKQKINSLHYVKVKKNINKLHVSEYVQLKYKQVCEGVRKSICKRQKESTKCY